jgi:hypothetical protein
MGQEFEHTQELWYAIRRQNIESISRWMNPKWKMIEHQNVNCLIQSRSKHSKHLKTATYQ